MANYIQQVVIDGKKYVPEDVEKNVTKLDVMTYISKMSDRDLLELIKNIVYEKIIDDYRFVEIDDMMDGGSDSRIVAKTLFTIYTILQN